MPGLCTVSSHHDTLDCSVETLSDFASEAMQLFTFYPATYVHTCVASGMGSTGRLGNAPCLAHSRQSARVARKQAGTAEHLLLLYVVQSCLKPYSNLQAARVQATIAMEREQAPATEGKEVPVPNPLDFEITVPDMSKVGCTSCSPSCGVIDALRLIPF